MMWCNYWPGGYGRDGCTSPHMRLAALQVSPANERPPVVSLAEMYQQLNLDPQGSPPSHPDDDLIELAVQAATEELTGPNGEGWLGRALMAWEYELGMMAWPVAGFGLPLPPLVSVEGITYVDGDGATQTMDAAAYTVTPGVPGILTPAYGTAWPAVRSQPASIAIRFTAGYADRTMIPAPIRQWIKARAGFFYENRESIITGTIATELPGFPAMLENYRVRGLFQP